MFLEKVIIKNCVFAEDVVITTYPRWSDYGCLTNALKVVYEDGDNYEENIFITEDVGDGAYDVEIESWGDTIKYQKHVLAEKIEEMKKENFKIYLNVKNGLNVRVRVIRGRKYPKGLEFNTTKAFSYNIPGTYGHETIFYIDGIDDNNNKIHINYENIEFVEVK